MVDYGSIYKFYLLNLRSDVPYIGEFRDIFKALKERIIFSFAFSAPGPLPRVFSK